MERPTERETATKKAEKQIKMEEEREKNIEKYS